MRNPRVTTPMTLLDIIKNGFFQQVRYLVESGCDLNQRDPEKRTTLMLCAFVEPEAWGVGICRLLIENGATLDYKDKYGLNAFHYSVIYDRLDLVRVFLKAIDFDLNACDKTGNTALHYAVKSGNSLVTRLIVQALMKYKVNVDKRNSDGYTALQEAYRLNMRKCVMVIENAEEMADASTLDANLPLDLKSGVFDNETGSIRSSRKTLSRPRSSMFSRRSSKSSFVTEYSYRRTPTIVCYENERLHGRRNAPVVIPPNEKNQKNLIRCVSMTDFRNNPEYLFHMTPMETAVDLSPPKRAMRAKSAFVRRSEVEREDDRDSTVLRTNWRSEFRKLYVHFQYQCTPSYRDTSFMLQNHDGSLPFLDKPLTPASSEHALVEEDKAKKSRVKSAAPIRQNTEENLLGKGRNTNKSNSRKISQNVGHGTGKMMGSIDGSLESSSESINSSVSSRKQADGKVSSKPPTTTKEPTAGRQSRSTNHKQVPALNVEEAQAAGDGTEPLNQDGSRLRVIDE